MNRQQFFQWLNDPTTLNQNSMGDLRELILEYPYFQTVRTLFLLNLRLQQDYRFDQELKRVAIFSADRSRLRELILALENLPISDHEKDIHLKNLEEQIKTSLKEIELKKSKLKELLEEKKAITGDFDQSINLSEDTRELPFRPLPKDNLLEEFLLQKQNNPQSRSVFYNPEDSARKSIEDNDEILSETLARLIAAQGKNEKAIKIYQKLMLKYPQKSSYFAAQIEKLRKE